MIKEEIHEQINSYISGELSEDESTEVRRLIESSEEVRVYYEQVSNMWRTLDGIEQIEPDPDYISKFWSKVEREESKKKYSFLNLFNLNKKWAFAGSFGVFLVICSFVINTYVVNNGNGVFVNNVDDETLLSNLDESIVPKTPDSLNIYGPWDDLEN